MFDNQSAARAQVREFLSTRFPKAALVDDQDMFALGLVNSLLAMELVVFVEEHFSVRVPSGELRPDSFRTINAIVDLIARLSPSQADSVDAGSQVGARS